MDSLKDLIERRNKAVHDAREILGRQGLAADDTANADRLLDEAGALDAKIAERQKDDGRAAKLAALEDRIKEQPRRITAPGDPGSGPGRKGDPEPLSVQIGKHTVMLQLGDPHYQRASAEYGQRFKAYLRGDYEGRNGHERLGLLVGDNTKGGYTAPTSMLDGLIKFLDDAVLMRELATVLPPTMEKSIGILSYDTDPGDADWTAEVPASAITEDDAARFGKREMAPHLLTKLLKMSRKLLRNSSMNLEAFFNSRLGYKFAITENKAFLTGNGVGRPLGVFTASADGLTTSQDVACAAATTFTGDDLIGCFMDLKEAYQRNSTWLVSRAFLKIARKLKSGDGQYLWQAGLAGGAPGTILDRPYRVDENCPTTYTTGQYIAAVGDWKAGYYIQDGLGLEIQRLEELLALTNQVGFLARKETDGMVVLPEALRRLKLG